MSICTNSNDKLIYINSDFRSAGTVSEYIIQLDTAIRNAEYIELIDTTCEYSDVIYRNGGMNFTLTKYSVENDQLVEVDRIEKSIHPYVHNIEKSIADFNNMFNNITLNITPNKFVADDYNYVNLFINSLNILNDQNGGQVTGSNNICCNYCLNHNCSCLKTGYCTCDCLDCNTNSNSSSSTINSNNSTLYDVVVLTDHDGFLENYFNIPYKQIIIAKVNKEIGDKNINVMSFIKELTTVDVRPDNYIHYVNNTPTNVNIVSREAFLYTNQTNPLIPLENQQYSIPLHNKSVGVFLETINGTNINIINTNGGIFNNCFYIHDNTSQRIRNISTSSMCIMGISSIGRQLEHVRYYFNTPSMINGFKVRLLYSDGTPYVINEMNQTGKTTFVLKVHSACS